MLLSLSQLTKVHGPKRPVVIVSCFVLYDNCDKIVKITSAYVHAEEPRGKRDNTCSCYVTAAAATDIQV